MQDERIFQDNTAAFPGTKLVTEYKTGDKKELHYFGMNQRQFLAYKLAPEVMKLMAKKSFWENVKAIFQKKNTVYIPSGDKLARICFQVADGFIEYGKSQSFKHNTNE